MKSHENGSQDRSHCTRLSDFFDFTNSCLIPPVGQAYVDIPTMEDIERLIVKKKKETLLKKYAPSEAQSND